MCFDHLSRSLVFSLLLFWIVSSLPAQQALRADQDRSVRESAPAAAYTNSMAVLDDSRILKKDDRVSYRVVQDKESPVELIVTDSGEVEVPLIGRVLAAGRTCKQLAYAIKGPLERDYYYTATVIVALDFGGLKSPGRVYITGQIHNQGPLDIPPDETFTVSRAILRAGGFADFANRKKVKLIRKNGASSQTIYVNVDAVVNKGKIDQDPVLEDGDTIIVPERLINF
jgi:polysaccharide biosynthesis/export protein